MILCEVVPEIVPVGDWISAAQASMNHLFAKIDASVLIKEGLKGYMEASLWCYGRKDVLWQSGKDW